MLMTMGHPFLYVMSGLYLCAVCRGMQHLKDIYSLIAPITRAQSGVNAAYEVTIYQECSNKRAPGLQGIHDIPGEQGCRITSQQRGSLRCLAV